MHAPVQLGLRQLGQRARKRGLELLAHLLVAPAQAVVNDARALGERSPQKTHEPLASQGAVVAELQGRLDESGYQAVQRHRLIAELALQRTQRIQARLVHGLHPARKHRVDQCFLGPEMVVDRGQIDLCRRRDGAQRRRIETELGEQLFSGIQDGFFRAA